jgi:hypothetical protein
MRLFAGQGVRPGTLAQVCICGGLPELRSMAIGLMEVLDVEVVIELRKQIPASGSRVERIEDQVSPVRIKESIEIAAVGIRDNRAIAAIKRGLEDFANGRGLPGPGGTNQLEVLGFVQSIERYVSEGDGTRSYGADLETCDPRLSPDFRAALELRATTLAPNDEPDQRPAGNEEEKLYKD